MGAVAALNVVAILLGGISMVPTLSSLLAPDAKDATTVRVVLGSSTDRAASLSGNTPGASLWDFNGNAIGHTTGAKKVRAQGSFVDITVNPRPDAGNIQAQYVSISNGGDDAICIAGISLTFPDGAKAGFTADVAADCGAFWSNSQTPILGQPATGDLKKPRCVWIDRDGSNGIPHQGIGFHIPSFSNSNANLASSYRDNKDLMCKSGPRFRMYPRLITEDSILVFPHPPEFITTSDNETLIGTDVDPGFIIENPGVPAANLLTGAGGPSGRRRDIRRRNKQYDPALSDSTIEANNSNGMQRASKLPLAERLIISPYPFNSARELCESQNSFGHSFVSLPENLFCDMTDKSLYYTCNGKISSCCFDIDKASFRACQKGSTLAPISKINGTSIQPATARARPATYGLDAAMMKGNKAYDSVQRWG